MKFLLSFSLIQTLRNLVDVLFFIGRIFVVLLPYVMYVFAIDSVLLINISCDLSLFTFILLNSLNESVISRIVANSDFFLAIHIELSIYARSLTCILFSLCSNS